MREYLFRGKTDRDGEWCVGHYIWPLTRSVDYGPKEPLIAIMGDMGSCHVLPETVSQWTGLVDKNGKKIFEGDVLYNGIGEPAVVDYLPGIFTVIYPGGHQALLIHYYESGVTEVTGNIYDNPELLKGK